jgi:hypothetical protein
MLVGTIPGIDDMCAKEAREKMWSAACAVADDDKIRIQRLEVSGGVLEGLALFERGRFRAEIDDVRAQPHGSEFETDAGAGAGFDEEIDDGFAPECRHLFDGAFTHLLEMPRGIENSDQFSDGERLQIEQVRTCPSLRHRDNETGTEGYLAGGFLSRDSNSQRAWHEQDLIPTRILGESHIDRCSRVVVTGNPT